MQKRQLVGDRLKTTAVLDNPLAKLLMQHIEKIDEEIKRYIDDLGLIRELEMRNPPCKNPCTPKN
jgi:hypothetical protein